MSLEVLMSIPCPMPEPTVLLDRLAYVESPRWHEGRLWFAHWGTGEIVAVDLPFGHAVVVNHPDAIRRVLIENQSNYEKDTLQRRVLSAGLGEGLLSVEGERWRSQRRTLAPLLSLGDLVMARRQLLNLAHLAEQAATLRPRTARDLEAAARAGS